MEGMLRAGGPGKDMLRAGGPGRHVKDWGELGGHTKGREGLEVGHVAVLMGLGRGPC